MCVDIYIIKVTNTLTLPCIYLSAIMSTKEFINDLLCTRQKAKDSKVRENDRHMKKQCYYLVRAVESILGKCFGIIKRMGEGILELSIR